jgi:hypothetical protein
VAPALPPVPALPVPFGDDDPLEHPTTAASAANKPGTRTFI